MCAAVKAATPTDDAASKTGDGDAITVRAEAALLFNDDGERRDLAPGAAARALPGLRDQRKAREFCDVVFRVAEGAEIWAHRFVMSATYSGCCELFTVAERGMSPEQEWTPPIRVIVEDLDSDMIEVLVDFAYRAPLHKRIGLHNVAKVLELAEKLKLYRLRDHCLKVLNRHLEAESCIDTYRLASSRGYGKLAEDAFRYLVRNFNEVWKDSAQFQALTPEEMRTILEDNRLYAPKEVDDTFPALLEWISADAEGRKAYLAKFLPLVRFARFSVTRSKGRKFASFKASPKYPENRTGIRHTPCLLLDFEKVITNPQVQGDEDSLKVLSVIHQTLSQPSMATGRVAGIDLSPKLWLTPRTPKDILFLFGGWASGPTTDMLTYNCRATKWRMMDKQNTMPRAYHGAAVVNRCIYFVGGFDGRDCYHSVVCFDVSLGRWSTKANMTYARCYVSVAVLQGYIYAMGGLHGRLRTNTVERYDVNKNVWSMVAGMNEIRSDAGAAAACGRIYIVGGYSGMQYLDSVECYDPSTDAWTRVLTMTSPRSGLKAVAHKDIIYIIGGSTNGGFAQLSSMVMLDVRRARFADLPNMPVAKCNFAAVVLEGQIYTIGGYSGYGTVKTVECYDIEARTWHSVTELSMSCSAAAAYVVRDVGNVESWI
ncbi:kelch-like protein 10 isoform X3 [Dermacentor albipictus]|uniref:kelch-like protein 10 isoform X3 n=1 Tax=Dermacentor albipictus TaxID=60249 RepID=UPI0038FD349D